MRLLADENFPGKGVLALREAGHDIGWIRTDSPGVSDTEVLARAQHETRVLLTFDKDFGELAYRWGLPAACGVVLFRFSPSIYKDIGGAIRDLLISRDDWAGHFSVIEPTRIRMRVLQVTKTDPETGEDRT